MKEDPRFIAGYDAGLNDGRLETKGLRLFNERKPQARKRNNAPRLDIGINGIVLTAMKDRPMRAAELKPLIAAAGFSAHSVRFAPRGSTPERHRRSASVTGRGE